MPISVANARAGLGPEVIVEGGKGGDGGSVEVDTSVYSIGDGALGASAAAGPTLMALGAHGTGRSHIRS